MKRSFAALFLLALAACSQAPPSGTDVMLTSYAAIAASTATEPPASASADTTADGAAMMLTKYHWQLASATDGAGARIDALMVQPDGPLQLDFDGRNVTVGNTCNRMRASYSLADGKLTIGTFASTMMACPDPKLMALDAAAGKYLGGTFALALDTGGTNPSLVLITAQGDRLAFIGNPTAEARFGRKGATVFLEVAPWTRPCNHPGMPNAQCLEVRELHYAANGVREGQPGPWHVLGQAIEGYTHAAGVRNVLRVKRYEIANPPADGSSVAYVLDMVIESQAPPH